MATTTMTDRPVSGMAIRAFFFATCGVHFLVAFSDHARAQAIHWSSAVGGNDHYYDVIRYNNSFTWKEARLDAEARGAHMATLTTQEEQDFVYNNLVNNSLHWNGRIGPWIGLHQTTFDAEPDGGWEWVTGEPFSFQNWGSGRPDNYGGAENYAQFYNSTWITPSPIWNDNEADDGSTYVIEYEVPAAVTMAEARNVPLGGLFTVEGVVTTTTDLVTHPCCVTIDVQDSTGGIKVFGPLEQMNQLFPTLMEGDRISVSGIAKSFNGVMEFDTSFGQFSAKVLDSPGVPAPEIITTEDFLGATGTAEVLESTLVMLPDVVFQNITPGSNFSGSANYQVSGTLGGRATIRVATGELDLVGTPIPRGPVTITGIFSQYDTSDPAPGVIGTGYQLQVRSLADIQYGADFDDDGDVDRHDLATWESSYGVDALADADGDGDSDGADFLAWQLQFGFGSSGPLQTSTVPEPTTLFLTATAVFAHFVRRWPGRRRDRGAQLESTY